MAAGLDLTLVGVPFSVPPISASWQGTLELEPETGGLKDVVSLAGKMRGAESSALCRQDAPSPGEVQDIFWNQLFACHRRWWDNRHYGLNSRRPEFVHRESQVLLWLTDGHEPAWVDLQLDSLDARTKPTSVGRFSSVSVESNATHKSQSERICTELHDDGRIPDAVNSLHHQVQQGCHVPRKSFYQVLKRCIKAKDLVSGRRIHVLTVKSGYDGDTFLATHLIGLYSLHGMLDEAMDVFRKVRAPDAYNWATIIFAYARNCEADQAAKAIGLYRQMRKSTSIKADSRIFSAVLKACASARNLDAGKDVHSHILGSGEKPDRFVQGALVDMYAKCGSLDFARNLFDKLPEKSVVTWTAMIAGYSQHGMGEEALSLYSSMQQEGQAPDSVTYVCLLQACSIVGVRALDVGKHLHAQIKDRGLEDDGPLTVSLINMYSKCGGVQDARRRFNDLREKNVVAWNTMIAGYAHHGMGLEALSLFSCMQQESATAPNSVTYVCLLQACASSGVVALDKGMRYCRRRCH